MASEYLKWKSRDVQPDAPLVLTKKQKVFNWWHYHKWFVIGGAVLLGITLYLIGNALGIGKTQPDVTFAYVGSAPLPNDTVKQLEKKLSAFAVDVNADGRITVKINQYPATPTEQGADAAEYAGASKVRLMGDLESRESCFFILDDVETFHGQFDILAAADGTIAAKQNPPEAYRWSALPQLADPPLGSYSDTILGKDVTGSSDELMMDFYLARRGYHKVDAPKELPGYDTVWKNLTKGESQ